MARIRSIKPDFWSDDNVTECSLSARLLFIGTWNFADDAGNLDRSPKQIKTRVFPIDDLDCEPLIQELITHGLLIEYSVSGQKFLHIRGFAKHQLINRPSKPVVPPFENSLSTHGGLTEGSVSTHDGGEGREGRDRKGEDGRDRRGSSRAHAFSSSSGSEPEPKNSDGENALPSDPSSHKNGSPERRNGNFEAINDTVEKLITDWKIPVTEVTRLAQMAHVSSSQVEESIRQLRDRGRLPTGVAA